MPPEMPPVVKRDAVEMLPGEPVPVICLDSGFRRNDGQRKDSSQPELFAKNSRSSAPC